MPANESKRKYSQDESNRLLMPTKNCFIFSNIITPLSCSISFPISIYESLVAHFSHFYTTCIPPLHAAHITRLVVTPATISNFFPLIEFRIFRDRRGSIPWKKNLLSISASIDNNGDPPDQEYKLTGYVIGDKFMKLVDSGQWQVNILRRREGGATSKGKIRRGGRKIEESDKDNRLKLGSVGRIGTGGWKSKRGDAVVEEKKDLINPTWATWFHWAISYERCTSFPGSFLKWESEWSMSGKHNNWGNNSSKN